MQKYLGGSVLVSRIYFELIKIVNSNIDYITFTV